MSETDMGFGTVLLGLGATGRHKKEQKKKRKGCAIYMRFT